MKKWCLSLILLLISMASFADSVTGIARLQYRVSSEHDQTIMQSVFLSFPNKLFLLELYENYYQPNPFQHLDFTLGKEIPGQKKDVIDWVLRSQSYSGEGTVGSAGLQFNLFKDKQFNSFVQIFPLKTSPKLGRYDILHYYSIQLNNKISLRGNNQLVFMPDNSKLLYCFVDVIYSINSRFDIYYRPSYSSQNNQYYGSKGMTNWVGLRINFSI